MNAMKTVNLKNSKVLITFNPLNFLLKNLKTSSILCIFVFIVCLLIWKKDNKTIYFIQDVCEMISDKFDRIKDFAKTNKKFNVRRALSKSELKISNFSFYPTKFFYSKV